MTNIIKPFLVTTLVSLFFLLAPSRANLWDNLWSNNRSNVSRVVFPAQFDLTLLWNPTQVGQLSPQKDESTTNYVQGHIMIDQKTNRLRMDTTYSTLSLLPQELVSYILDFENKQLYLKQKNSCKFFDIVLKNMVGSMDKDGDDSSAVGFDFEVDQLPNIAELFDLFPYVMYYNNHPDDKNSQIENQNYIHEFKYSYPLGKALVENDAELLMHFQQLCSDKMGGQTPEEIKAYDDCLDELDKNDDTDMLLRTIILRANSLNITEPFRLNAKWPGIKEQNLTYHNMSFGDVNCTKATEDDQTKLNHYVQRIFELVTKQ